MSTVGYVFNSHFEDVTKPVKLASPAFVGDVDIDGDVNIDGLVAVRQDLIVQGTVYVGDSATFENPLITTGVGIPTDVKVGGLQIVTSAGATEAGLYRYPGSLAVGGKTYFILSDGVSSLSDPPTVPTEGDLDAKKTDLKLRTLVPVEVKAETLVQAPTVSADLVRSIAGLGLTLEAKNGPLDLVVNDTEMGFLSIDSSKPFEFRFTSAVSVPVLTIGNTLLSTTVPARVPLLSSFQFGAADRGLFDAASNVSVRVGGADNLSVRTDRIDTLVPIRLPAISSVEFGGAGRGLVSTGARLSLQTSSVDRLWIDNSDPTRVVAVAFESASVYTDNIISSDPLPLEVKNTVGGVDISGGDDINLITPNQVTFNVGGFPRAQVKTTTFETSVPITLPISSMYQFADSNSGLESKGGVLTLRYGGSTVLYYDGTINGPIFTECKGTTRVNTPSVLRDDVGALNINTTDGDIVLRTGGASSQVQIDGETGVKIQTGSPVTDRVIVTDAKTQVTNTLECPSIVNPNTITLGASSSLSISRMIQVILPAAGAFASNLVLKVNTLGQVTPVLSTDDDSIPLVGVSVNAPTGAGADCIVCIGPIFECTVANTSTVDPGDPIEKSDVPGEHGRVSPYAVSPGHFGVALTGGTGGQLIKVMKTLNEVF